MKRLSLKSLLAALLFGYLVVLPTLPFAHQPNGFKLDFELASTLSGVSQIFFDLGSGIRESDSSTLGFSGSTRYHHLQLGLGEGKVTRLRFDVTNQNAAVRLRGLRIADRNGLTVRALNASDLLPTWQIREIRQDKDCIIIFPTDNANDPHVDIVLKEPLELRNHLWVDLLFWTLKAVVAGAVFLLLASAIAALWKREVFRLVWLKKHPKTALALVACLSVAASDYSVVFAGRGYVSPNFTAGATCLYDCYPSVPGSRSTLLERDNGSDVGATIWYHYPAGVIQGRALASGEFPWWNRYNDMGTTLLGQGQSMIGDPLQFLVDLAGNSPLSWDFKYLTARALFCFCVGLLALLLTETLGVAAMVAASSAFLGFMVYRLNHPAIFTFCYAPWVIYFWLASLREQKPRKLWPLLAGLLVAETALLNSGTVKETYMLLGVTNALGLVTGLFTSRSLEDLRRALLPPLLAGLAALLINAPLWLTFLRSLSTGYSSYQTPQAYQIQPALLLGLFDEIFYRPLTQGSYVFNPSLNLFLGLGVLYFFATFKEHLRNRSALAFCAVGVGAGSLAFGVIPATWIKAVPFLGNVAHIDNCFSCALLLICLLLAGIGFDTARRRWKTDAFTGDLVVTALLLLALVAAWLGFSQAEHRGTFPSDVTFSVYRGGASLNLTPTVFGCMVSLIVAALGLLALAHSASRGNSFQTPSKARLAFLALCMISLHWRFAAHLDFVGLDPLTRKLPDRMTISEKSEAVALMRATQEKSPSRVVGTNHSLAPGWTGVHRLEGINGADAIVNPYYLQLVSATPLQIFGWSVWVPPTDVAKVKPFLDAFNVRYYGDFRSDQGLMKRSLELVKITDLDVYESASYWPRGFYTDTLATVSDAPGMVNLFAAANGKPLAATLPATRQIDTLLASLPQDLAQRKVIPGRDFALGVNDTAFTVTTDGPGVAVLTEVWADHAMKATVDGKDVRPFRVNHAFRGVPISGAGTHRIVFSYRPPGYTFSLLACGAGFALAIGGSVVLLRRRHA